MDIDFKSLAKKWGVLVAVALVAVFGFIQFANAKASGARMERQIEATYRNNQNVLSSYTTRIREMAQIPEMMTQDLTTVMEAALSARYGDEGSQAVFQWINENYPGRVDPALYTRIQAAIEAGRIEFRNEQTLLLDQKRVYQTQLDYLWNGFWLRLAGFPRINLDDYDVIVAGTVQEQFESGEETEIDLRR